MLTHYPSGRTLVFSIGTNGFSYFYRSFIQSQRRYAALLSAEYFCVDLRCRLSASDSAWLKIPLILRALECGFEWVLFLDADIEVKAKAPDFRLNAIEGKDLYLVNGHSGRPNSGLMMVRNSTASRKLFNEILDSIDEKIEKENAAPYENGLVIQKVKGVEILQQLDLKWNNTSDYALEDYFRHYTGPMKRHTPVGFFDKVLAHGVSKFRPLLAEKQLSTQVSRGNLTQRLDTLTAWAIGKYGLLPVSKTPS